MTITCALGTLIGMHFVRSPLRRATLAAAGLILLVGAGCGTDTDREAVGSVREAAKKADRVLAWQPALVKKALAPGESSTVSVTFEATGHIAATSVHIAPSLTSFVTVKPSRFPALRKGDKRTLELKFVAPASAKPQVVKGEISLRKGNECDKHREELCASLPVELTIVDPLAQAVQKLEASGAIPILDRSASLAGPDTNSNGIRDDIDAYIAKQAYPEAKRRAVEQLARGYQVAVSLGEGPISQEVARPVSERLDRAINCAFAALAPDAHAADALQRKYRELTANTPARMRAYGRYSDALDGAYLPMAEGDTCEN